MEVQKKIKKDHRRYFELMRQSDEAERLTPKLFDIHRFASLLERARFSPGIRAIRRVTF